MVIAAPILEELIFRGVNIRGIVKKVRSFNLNTGFQFAIWSSSFKPLAICNRFHNRYFFRMGVLQNQQFVIFHNNSCISKFKWVSFATVC